MNITFLIGNGFDIGVGLKSSFRDFFPTYLNNSAQKPERIKRLADEIDRDYETWSDFEKALGQYTSKFTPENKQELIAQIRDFESDFIKYLKNQEKELAANIYNQKNDVYNTMLRGLLTYYSLQNLARESNARLHTLHESYKSEVVLYNFVNFNYTHVLDNFLSIVSECEQEKATDKKKLFDIGSIVHVHGDYNDHPIIGLNDSSQIKNKELAQDESLHRYLLKPLMNQSLRTGNDRMATELINKSKVICVYGMSMGDTDKKWWKLLITWLNGAPDRQLIIFSYDKNYTTDTPYGWLEKEDYYIDKFIDACKGTSINVNNLRSRIHISINKNIFQMDLKQLAVAEYATLIANLSSAKPALDFVMEHSDEVTTVNEQAKTIAYLPKVPLF